MPMTTAIYAASAALGLASIVLFLVGVRRLLRRQTEVVATMLDRFDERLASFAQTLNDAFAQPRAGQLDQPVAQEALDTHGTLLRMLELATDRTAADGAFAALAKPSGPPTIASVRLSQEELTQIAQIGLPDYHGARAIQVAFNQGAGEQARGGEAVQSGLFVSLLDEVPSTIAVVTRSRSRRFSDEDIEIVEGIVRDARPALERALALREPDPVPELDPLTDLYDRRSFFAILEREIAKARAGRYGLTLLAIDVDRLTTLNARVGRLAADDALATVAGVLRAETGRDGLPARLGGGSFAVLVPHGDAGVAEGLFRRYQDALATARPPERGEPVSLSAGVAELTPEDDAHTLVSRAHAALALAKQAGRGGVAGELAPRLDR